MPTFPGVAKNSTLSNSDNSRVDSFLAKVRIQGNWPSQTASLPPRPPMQGAGYGPPPHRHRKHGVGGGRQLRNFLSAITLQRHAATPTCPPSRHDDCTQGSLGLPLAKYWSG